MVAAAASVAADWVAEAEVVRVVAEAMVAEAAEAADSAVAAVAAVGKVVGCQGVSVLKLPASWTSLCRYSRMPRSPRNCKQGKPPSLAVEATFPLCRYSVLLFARSSHQTPLG